MHGGKDREPLSGVRAEGSPQGLGRARAGQVRLGGSSRGETIRATGNKHSTPEASARKLLLSRLLPQGSILARTGPSYTRPGDGNRVSLSVPISMSAWPGVIQLMENQESLGHFTLMLHH